MAYLGPEDHKAPEWTGSEVIQLITEYGNRPALWDPECEDYKNRFMKHKMWLELAEIFKCGKLEVERKMKILNSQYRRERLKAVRMRMMGKKHRVTWYGYRAFGFLNKHWVRYKNRSNLMANNTIKQESEEQEFNATTELMPFFDEDDSPPQETETFVKENEENFKNEESELVVETPKEKEGVVKVMHDNKDEWALFGELVTYAFRKMPDDRTRCIVKHKINTILYEAELATYDTK